MAANIICNSISNPLPTADFGDGVGDAGCYTRDGTGSLQYFISFGSDGLLTEGSSLASAPNGNRGRWAAASQTTLFEISCGAQPADGMANGTFYPMPKNLIWSVTSTGGPVGKFLNTVLTIRRIADGVVVGTTQLQNVQLGLNTECI